VVSKCRAQSSSTDINLGLGLSYSYLRTIEVVSSRLLNTGPELAAERVDAAGFTCWTVVGFGANGDDPKRNGKRCKHEARSQQVLQYFDCR
jgi:hypothetical protein